MHTRTLAGFIAVSAVLVGSMTACGTDVERPVAAALSTPLSTPAPAPLTPCEVPGIPTATCGTITVPLDREDPAAGTTEVGFAVVPRSDRTQPSLGTVATNPGGPGTGAIDLTGQLYADGLAPILDRRDLLLIDPRGVGRSGPISCPALDDVSRLFAPLEAQRAAVGECGRQLGDQARYYTTAAVADDFDDVRAALGIDRLDLLGDSYGTFLMPTYVQRHPEHVRSVVLSGAYPVHGDYTGSDAAAAFRSGVALVCERSGSCSGEVVLSDLAALAERLRAQPTTIDVEYDGRTYPVTLDEWRVVGAIFKIYGGSADPEARLAVGVAAAAARTGDLGPIGELVRAHVTEQAGTIALGATQYSDALSWATTCHDYTRDFDLDDSVADRRADYDELVAGLDPRDFAPFSPTAWVTRDSYDTGACLEWPADPTATEPFPQGTELPDVPVLVMAGDLDANTTISAGRAAAAQFPNAEFVEVPDAGHTPTVTPEGAERAMEFIVRDRP